MFTTMGYQVIDITISLYHCVHACTCTYCHNKEAYFYLAYCHSADSLFTCALYVCM